MPLGRSKQTERVGIGYDTSLPVHSDINLWRENKNIKALLVTIKKTVLKVKTEKTRYMFVSLGQHSG